jgi:hypothetical protein
VSRESGHLSLPNGATILLGRLSVVWRFQNYPKVRWIPFISTPEGDGAVLDRSCLMFISNLWVGRTRNNSRLPVVMAGGPFKYVNAGDENRKVCSLYLSLTDRFGIKLDHFGDADTRLDRI